MVLHWYDLLSEFCVLLDSQLVYVHISLHLSRAHAFSSLTPPHHHNSPLALSPFVQSLPVSPLESSLVFHVSFSLSSGKTTSWVAASDIDGHHGVDLLQKFGHLLKVSRVLVIKEHKSTTA